MPVHVVKRKGRLKPTTTARNPLRELSGCKKNPARRRVRAYYRHKSSIVSSDPLFSLRFTLGDGFGQAYAVKRREIVISGIEHKRVQLAAANADIAAGEKRQRRSVLKQTGEGQFRYGVRLNTT